MGIGHIAVGLASKRWAPRASLGWLVAAPVFVDILWSFFIFFGIERARIVPGITKSMPLDLEYVGISHSLVTVLGWAVLFALVYNAGHRDVRASIVLALGVFSHFVLDFISHRPDMPILPSGPRVGLGLWNYPIAAVTVEALMLLGGVLLYTRAVSGRSTGARVALWSVSAFLLLTNVGAYFGPPPPDIKPMAALNLSVLLVVWAFHAIDRRLDTPRRTELSAR
jgi:hypothetical protein